jgi:hypothetical protein
MIFFWDQSSPFHVVGTRDLRTLRFFHKMPESGFLISLFAHAGHDVMIDIFSIFRFNIWNTGADINFDRIAHLAKLVFSTKGVIISLIDGNDQWCKSEWGLNTGGSPREHSFCGHAVLQRFVIAARRSVHKLTISFLL